MPDHELLHLTCLMLNSTPMATALLLSESILSISQAHTIINFEIYTRNISFIDRSCRDKERRVNLYACNIFAYQPLVAHPYTSE